MLYQVPQNIGPDFPLDFFANTTEGASRTDLEGEQLNDGRVGAVDE